MAYTRRSRTANQGLLNAIGAPVYASVHLARDLHRETKGSDFIAPLASIDLAAGLIDFETPGRKQTNKRRGAVRIPPRLLPHLQRARKRGTDLGYVLNRNGERILDIKKGFAAACERADLQGVTPHTLRHTAATWLMQRGTSVWEAAGFLAMSEKMLRDVYGHHHPDFQKEAAENIGRRLKRM